MPELSGQQRRAEFVDRIIGETGVDEAMIERLVRRFYEAVRADGLLGPIFEAKIHDWRPHLEQMVAFWSSVVLMSGRYHGQPMGKHLPLPLETAHFQRWLAPFEAAALEVCPAPAAAVFIERAHRIAESLQLGLSVQRGELPTRSPG
jgi:hemoglobin